MDVPILGMSTLQDRVEIAIAEGFRPARLAKAAGVSSGAVSQWRSGETQALKLESAIGLSALTGWSVEWWSTGVGPRVRRAPTSAGVAHAMIHDAYRMPTQLTWGALMQTEDLPVQFIVEMPDDALAPNVPKSTRLIFDCGAAASPGMGVLVKDAAGRRHIRRYAQGVGDSWLAQAVNPAYATLDSARDGLAILSVMVGRLDGAI